MADPLSETLPLLLSVAGLVLIIMEAMAPGAHLIVLGVALLGAGLIGMLVGGPFASIFALAGMTAVFGALAFYVYRNFDFYGGKGGPQTSDSSTLVGQLGHVTERVTPRSGEVKLDDGGFSPYYEARSIDGEISEGTEIVVIDPGGGNVLTVESIEDLGEDDIDRELARERARREAAREDERETETESGAAGG